MAYETAQVWLLTCAGEEDNNGERTPLIMDDETTTLPTAQDDTVSRKCTRSTPPLEGNKATKGLPKSGRKSQWIAVLVTILIVIGTASCGESKPTESLGHENLSVKHAGTREDIKETRLEFGRIKDNLTVASDKDDEWNVEQVAAKTEKKSDKKKSGKKKTDKKRAGKKNSGKKKADKKKAEKRKAEKRRAEKKKAEKKKAEKKKAEEERAAREKAEQEQAAQQAAAEEAARQAAEQAAQEQARQAAEQAARRQAQMQAPAPDANVVYPNCAAVRAAGRAPLYAGEPGYHPALDRDHDGIACE